MGLSKLETPRSFLSHVHLEHLYAGVSGGVISTLILHPLDLIKIRFQVNEGQGTTARPEYRGMVHAVRTIVKNTGLLGLYQGVTPNVWGAGLSWGFYFLFYNSVKTWMQDGDTKKNLGAGKHMLIASVAGFTTLVLTNPLWVVKTRLCLQYEKSALSEQPNKSVQHYRGMGDALIKIFQLEGMRGLYKGFIPGVLGVSHGALQFMAYEELKSLNSFYRQQPLDARLATVTTVLYRITLVCESSIIIGLISKRYAGSGEYIIFAALSKMFAATLTYPYQVVRSRLQDQHREYEGVMDVVRQIIRIEGKRGFYKGISPYLLHVTPNICIVFLLYEFMTSPCKEPICEQHTVTIEGDIMRVANVTENSMQS